MKKRNMFKRDSIVPADEDKAYILYTDILQWPEMFSIQST